MICYLCCLKREQQTANGMLSPAKTTPSTAVTWWHRQHLGHQAGALQRLHDERGRAVLSVADLGVGVDVTA